MTSSATRVLCDWGGSHLRAYLEVDGVVREHSAGPGIGALDGAPAIEALRAALSPWSTVPGLTQVYLCGMAGSRNGLLEVPYCAAPASIEAWARGCAQRHDGRLQLTIAPGVQGLNLGGRPDVIRGEETQVFGAQALQPQLATGRQLLVLPGTHSKWIETREGRIERFQSFMTGELFALLCEHSSLLRAGADDARHEEGLEAGLARGASGDLSSSLFEARAAQLVEARTRGWARGYLSGLLIASEVRTMRHTDFISGRLSGPLTLVGDPQLTALYARALAGQSTGQHIGQAIDQDIDQNMTFSQLDGTECVLAGLKRLTEPYLGG